MLYDSTKTLLQTILRVLETDDESRWDDQNESGNACLYEMHQMSGPLYKAYRTDNTNSVLQSRLPEKLNRAMPHVRSMVIAIRHRDRARALQSGKAALAEMNGTSRSLRSGCCIGPQTESNEASNVLRQQGKPTAGQYGLMVEDGRSSRRIRLASGK